MTRGRCGSLAFQRVTLSFTTHRRFIPAHEETIMDVIEAMETCSAARYLKPDGWCRKT